MPELMGSPAHKGKAPGCEKQGIDVCGRVLRNTERLALLIAGTNDAARLHQYVCENRAHLATTAPVRPESYYSRDNWPERLRENQRRMQAGAVVPLVLVHHNNPNGPIVGDITFSNIIRGPFLACYLGFNLHSEQVGKGLMFEALSHAIDYVFGELQLHRIMANYMPTNQRSGRLLKRLGFSVLAGRSPKPERCTGLRVVLEAIRTTMRARRARLSTTG